MTAATVAVAALSIAAVSCVDAAVGAALVLRTPGGYRWEQLFLTVLLVACLAAAAVCVAAAALVVST